MLTRPALSGIRVAATLLLVVMGVAAWRGVLRAGDRALAAELDSPLYRAPVDARPATVVALGPPPARSAGVMAAPRRILRIGALEGDRPYLFARIEDLDVDMARGRLVVLDGMARQVRVFSLEGEFLSEFGRQGAGPGEFEAPTSVMLLPWNDRVAVWDAAFQRITVFSIGGEVIATHAPGGRSLDRPILLPAARTAGSVRVRGDGFIMETRSDPLATEPDHQRGYLLRLDTLATVADTVLKFRIPAVVARQRSDGGSTHWQWDHPRMFLPEARWDVEPDGGIVFAPGGPYEVFLYGPTGEPRLGVRRAVRPEPVTRADRIRLLEGAAEAGLIAPRVALIERLQRSRFATVRPAVTGILADPRGGFWARRFDTRDDGSGRSRVWDLYHADGQPAGAIAFPRRFDPLVIADDVVYGVGRDELGVEHIEAYAVPFRAP